MCTKLSKVADVLKSLEKWQSGIFGKSVTHFPSDAKSRFAPTTPPFCHKVTRNHDCAKTRQKTQNTYKVFCNKDVWGRMYAPSYDFFVLVFCMSCIDDVVTIWTCDTVSLGLWVSYVAS